MSLPYSIDRQLEGTISRISEVEARVASLNSAVLASKAREVAYASHQDVPHMVATAQEERIKVGVLSILSVDIDII
jgi:hypothetical protein